MIVTKRNSGVLAVWRLLGVGALILALALTSTGTAAAFDRDPSLEFGRSLYDAGNGHPRGLWSDGTTMWVVDDGDDKLYAYDLEDKTRVPAKDFNSLKAAGNEDPAGIWSDGATMWVADYVDDKVYAYLTGSRAWDPAQDFDTLRVPGNREPAGIWSDGTTMWVADDGDDKLYAYDRATKARAPAKDFDTLAAAGNNDPRGIWSDGATMWVADHGDDKLYAYDLATKARVPAREFETLQGANNNAPTGIWSDGATMWVAEYGVGCISFYSDGGCQTWGPVRYGIGIFAYDTPVGTLQISPTDPIADPAAFDRDPSLEFGRRLYDAGNNVPQGIWSDGATMWVADDGDDKLYAYDLEDKTRVPAKDFDGLKAAGNEDPAGIWSDGATMWVADYVDDKIYAYLTGSRAWDPAQDFDTLRVPGNREPAGIWSDGTTLWVADNGDDKLYAYDLATKARVPAREFETLQGANNNVPIGIWSDGATMWVADHGDDKLYAYDLATKARVPAREFETLQGANNNAPTGIWSDGATMWVAEYGVGCISFYSDGGCQTWGPVRYGIGIFAYDTPVGTLQISPTDPIADPAAFDRDPSLEFGRSLYDAGNNVPQGIWSDGATMWVADDGDDKLYAYDLEDKTRVPAKDFDGLKAAGNEDPAGIWSDGATMWVADYVDDKIYAYLTGSRAWDPAQDFDTLRAAGNREPAGIWSDGTTLWVADNGDDKLYAYDLATKARVPAREFETLQGANNNVPIGIWSDGATMWVADHGDDKLYAYDLATKARVPAREFETLQGANNNAPTGIWSDGATMWVAEYGVGCISFYSDGGCQTWGPVRYGIGIFAYDTPVGTLQISPTDPIADPAAFDRDPSLEFGRRLYDAGNNVPQGIWSDGATMWVADDGDDKLYAYDLEDKTRVPAKDFDGLKAAGNEDPAGIWSDGATMWVLDYVDDKIYAYSLAAKARDPAQDFDTLRAAGNREPAGIWSDGTTLWVADNGDDKLYAYDLATKARVPAREFETLQGANNNVPIGIWSDGATMWVADHGDDKLYAYDLATKARVPAREFETLQGANNNAPTGIWSDGATMWVAEYGVGCISFYSDGGCQTWGPVRYGIGIFAYEMPPKLPTTPPGVAVIGSVSPGAGSLTVSWSAPSGDASGITAYDLRYIPTGDDEAADANWTVVEDVWTGAGPLQYALTGLTDGTQYDVQVRAVNSAGDGAWSATASGTPTLPTGASATRSFSAASVAPGGQVVVTIAAADYGSPGGVTETLPTGFSYVSSSLADDDVLATGQQVRFTLLGEPSFTYTVTASSVEGAYSFSGVLLDSERKEVPVGGDFSITVGTESDATAARSFSTTQVAPGGGVVVTIDAADYGPTGGVTETLPAGFSYVSSSLADDDVLVTGQQVRFTLLSVTSFTYTVTASSEEGDYSFSGVLLDSEKKEVTVGGDLRITVGTELIVAVTTDAAAPVRIGTAIPVTATFSAPVTGFDVGDISVGNGAAGNFAGSGAVYTFDVTPNAVGDVTVDIAADAAAGADDSGNAAAAQLSLGIPYDDNGSGVIDRSEVIEAINDYLFGDGSVGRSHVIALINIYLFQ